MTRHLVDATAARSSAVDPPPRSARSAAVLLLLASTIAAIIGGAIFVLFAYADFLTGPLRRVSDFALANAVVLVMVAGSPVVAALLVGYAHMKRAMRRRAEQRLGADVEK